MKALTSKNFSYVILAAATLIGGNAMAANTSTEIRVPGLTIQGQPSRSFAEAFKLYEEAGYMPDAGCDRHTSLELDVAQINGKIAVLEEKISGICEIHVVPNTRIYRLVREDVGCGSSVYKGSVMTNEGLNSIEILDHRNRRCRDIVPARVIVTETRENQTTTLYSSNLVIRPIADEPAPITCMAYWEGYTIKDGACVLAGTSGCKNPFEFSTQSACEEARQPR